MLSNEVWNFSYFFPASSPGENVEMIPNTTNQDHDAVESMDNIVADNEGKNLTSKISEPSIESETDSNNRDNCAKKYVPQNCSRGTWKNFVQG